jgi:para-aminobenzoate synthetase / 4-amino-4-deoxychorismate lyase
MTRATLDFPDADGASLRLGFAGPSRIIAAHALPAVLPALRAVEQAAAAGSWAVGFVAYDAAPAFDDALMVWRGDAGLPLLWFAIFDAPATLPRPAARVAHAPAPRWTTATNRQRYDAAIADIREAIAAGDVYQVNHTLSFGARYDAAPRALYDDIVAARHGLYHALIETDDWAIVSASPELFLDIAAGAVTTRPMKGTARRGRWTAEDDAAALALAASAKDRAENLMIVDLLRNDLGRIADFGSVHVPRIFEVESYPTVHQLTSTVVARPRPGTSLADIFAATFPCGSVTGAPKIAAMRAIARLEDAPRGVYCGAIGVVRPDGSATFNVAIRTLVLDRHRQTASYGAGGGITWDSSADAEYDEAVAKAAILTERIPAFRLLETLRLDHGAYSRLDRHLHRLAESARYWRFADGAAHRARRALDGLRHQRPDGRWRVRVSVQRSGATAVTCTPLARAAADFADAAAAGPACVAIATTAVSSTDRLLFHKTTARDTYRRRRARFPHALDVLLFNEDGAATEFTTGNLVIERGGRLLTPARSCGLLAGTMRAELLEAGTVEEAAIGLDDVRAASRLWLINSVRGWVRVALPAVPGLPAPPPP